VCNYIYASTYNKINLLNNRAWGEVINLSHVESPWQLCLRLNAPATAKPNEHGKIALPSRSIGSHPPPPPSPLLLTRLILS